MQLLIAHHHNQHDVFDKFGSMFSDVETFMFLTMLNDVLYQLNLY